MKGHIPHPLRQARALLTPAVTVGTTAGAYLDMLASAAGDCRAAQVALGTFRRWLKARQTRNDSMTVDENLFAELIHDMERGSIKPIRKRHRQRKYGVSVKQVPVRIYELHNAQVGKDPRFLRRLVDFRSIDRYRFFLDLTPLTQEALIWFEEEGVRTKKARMGGLPLTVATRLASITDAFCLLRRLKLTGLEQVTEEHVRGLVPKTGPEDPEYRRVVKLLNAVKTVYRACVEKGLLEHNPTNVIPHNAFTAYGTRDFLPPEGLARIRNTGTDAQELRNPERLVDRVILLLLTDTAVRRSELASLERNQLRKGSGGYEIDLRAQNQKGAGKAAVVLPILYPETTDILDRYLRWRDAQAVATGTRLILNRKGMNVTAGVIAEAVKREGARLELRTYYKKRPPAPHDLRRTFAMCNAAPLGLNMQAHELADRLRDDIQVVFTHYCRNNPLIAGERAQVYRGRLNGKLSVEDALGMVDKLAGVGLPDDVVASLRQQVRVAAAPPPVVETAQVVEREWVPEEEAVADIKRAWGHVPVLRKLRDYLRSKGGLARNRERGKLLYDAKEVKVMLEAYVPLSRLPGLTKTVREGLAADPAVIKIGRDKLMSKDKALRLLIEVKDKVPALTGT